MPLLDPAQQQRALEVMREYLGAPIGPNGRTPRDNQLELDKNRRVLIAEHLGPLLEGYLAGRVPLGEFKAKVDGLNKKNEYWGFKGIKGQMFFNMLTNTAVDPAELDQELKAAIALPANNDAAKSRIRTFTSYAKRLGDSHVDQGGTAHGKPKIGSIPFFLSYFWQIRAPESWPVYYTNGVQTMEDLNLWRPTVDLADNYVLFKRLQEELAELFSSASGLRFTLYDVEHVFWFKGGNPYGGNKPAMATAVTDPEPPPVRAEATADGKLPDSYVPPIVAVIPALAKNDPKLAEAAKASGTSLERAFEKSVNAAFTIMGYQTQLLGQGQGRVPDGRALDLDNSYAIVWDAKARTDGYSIGTDDRTIREYITTQSRELVRKRSLRNIYYLIVSSVFQDDADDLIREIKMETDISEVCPAGG